MMCDLILPTKTIDEKAVGWDLNKNSRFAVSSVDISSVYV